MKQLLLIGGLVLSSMLASAQVYRDGYGRPTERYGRSERYDRNARADAVSRALEDLSRARSYGYVDRHERKHFEKAESELRKFQDRWARGHFDNHHLDEAISNLQHLVNADQVAPRDREMLSRDLYSLRDFRAGGGRYSDGRGDGYYRR